MKRSTARIALGIMALGCIVLMSGCGVSEMKLTQAEAKIKALQDKGLPDSAVTDAKVFLFKVRTAKKLGNSADASASYDSLTKILARTESDFAAAQAQYKPFVDSVIAAVGTARKQLSGMLLEPVDSVLALVDSLSKANRLLEAKKECDELVAEMPGLIQSQKKTIEMHPKFVGTWSRTEKEDAGAVRKEAYTLGKDGSLKSSEEKKGKSNEALKEDWQFLSSGTWANIADTVYLFITKETCARQTYANLKAVNGKPQWVETKGKTYKDSTVSKNRFMTWEELTVGGYKKK